MGSSYPGRVFETEFGGEEAVGDEEASEMREKEGDVGGAKDERPPHGVEQPGEKRVRLAAASQPVGIS